MEYDEILKKIAYEHMVRFEYPEDTYNKILQEIEGMKQHNSMQEFSKVAQKWIHLKYYHQEVIKKYTELESKYNETLKEFQEAVLL